VTGASSGVGAATAVALAKRGAKSVILVARNRERLEEVAGRVRAAGANAEIYSSDLSDPVAVDNLAATILATHGTPSLLVHAAGAGRWRRLTEMSAHQALDCMNSPYTSAMLMTRAFLPAMLKIERGHISIPQSPACFCAPGGATAYVSTRFALRGLYEALWADLYGSRVTVAQVVMNEVADSNYFTGDATGHARIPGIGMILGAASSCEACAKAVVSTAEKGNSEGYSNLSLQVNMEAQKLLPGVYSLLTALTSPGRYILCAEPDTPPSDKPLIEEA